MALGPLTNLDKDIEDSAGKSGKYANMEGNCQPPPTMTHFWEMREHTGPRELCIKGGSCRPQQMGPQPREESFSQA